MKPEIKFKLKTYIYYLFVEPWTEKVSLPNFRTISLILLYFSLFYKLKILLLISIVALVIFHAINEYKSGKYIYWYRQRKYGAQREALKKIREEKKIKKQIHLNS